MLEFMANYDAIFVPGGGIRDGGTLPPWSAARFDHVLALETEAPVVCLSVATPHVPPPLTSTGFPIRECAAGAYYLMERGIAPERIRLEALSLDTIGNAYFAKLLHVDPAGWQRLLIVTSEFHMARTRAIFEWVFGFDPGRYELNFAATPNLGLSPEAAAARSAKEQQGLERLRLTQQEVRTAADLHQWIFTRHDAYSAAGSIRDRMPLDSSTAESY